MALDPAQRHLDGHLLDVSLNVCCQQLVPIVQQLLLEEKQGQAKKGKWRADERVDLFRTKYEIEGGVC